MSAKLDVILRAQGDAIKAIGKLEKALKLTDAELKKVANSSKKLNATSEKTAKAFNLMAVSAKIASVAIAAALAKAVVNFAKDGAVIEAQLGAVGDRIENLPKLMADVARETGNMIPRRKMTDLISLMDAFNLPLALSSKLLGEAAKAGIRTGQDFSFMATSIIKAIGRLEPRWLDNLGVIVKLNEATKRAMETTGKGIKDLTQQEKMLAFAALALEDLTDKNKKIDLTTNKLAGMARSTTKLADSFDDFKVAASNLWPILDAGLKVVTPLVRAFAMLADHATLKDESYERPKLITKAYVLLEGYITRNVDAFAKLSKQLGGSHKAMVKLAELDPELRRLLGRLGEIGANAPGWLGGISRAMVKNSDAWKEASVGLRVEMTKMLGVLTEETSAMKEHGERLSINEELAKRTTDAVKHLADWYSRKPEPSWFHDMTDQLSEATIQAQLLAHELSKIPEPSWFDQGAIDASLRGKKKPKGRGGKGRRPKPFDLSGQIRERQQQNELIGLKGIDYQWQQYRHSIQDADAALTKHYATIEAGKRSLWVEGIAQAEKLHDLITKGAKAQIDAANEALDEERTKEFWGQVRAQEALAETLSSNARVELDFLTQKGHIAEALRQSEKDGEPTISLEIAEAMAVHELESLNITKQMVQFKDVLTSKQYEQLETVLRTLEAERNLLDVTAIRAAERAEKIYEWGDAFGHVSAQMMNLQDGMSDFGKAWAGQLGSINDVTNALGDYVQITNVTEKDTARAISAVGAATSKAVTGFVDGVQEKAAIQAVFELAMGVATAFYNPAESASHFVAAAMLGAIAGTYRAPPAEPVEDAGGTGGGGGAGGGQQGIIINFHSGIIMGKPSEINHAINQAVSSASETGYQDAAAGY